MSERVVVVGHFDVHGVVAAYLATKAYGAAEAYANFPQTSPENLVNTLMNLYAAAPSRLQVVIVDIPVNLKDPVSFVTGLENFAARHSVLFLDHHESSVQFISQFRAVKAIFLGPSALVLNNHLLSQIRDASDLDRTLAIVGAVGDRDPEVVKQGLLTSDIQEIADGLDVLVRERDGALNVLRSLLSSPQAVIERARQRAREIPVARLRTTVGPVVVADTLPEMWGPKSLEKLAFQRGAWYAVGHEYVSRQQQWVVRAIIRWDVAARMPNLPLPGTVARELWPVRNVIGHPSAPSVAATSEAEAVQMAEQWARTLADKATVFASPKVTSLISESNVGLMLAEILQRLAQLSEQQTKMYEEYLELKKRQVELLERASREQRARYD